MKILIPMAGRGQRFVDAGYTEPKPFINVLGKAMIERVVESLGGPEAGEYIFVISADMAVREYGARLRTLVPGCRIVVATQPTMGAACTALLARDYIDTDASLLIANSDQIVKRWNRGFDFTHTNEDGMILTFRASNPKWSFVAIDDDRHVWGVAEKQVISHSATCGIYWYRHGYDFVRHAEAMIDQNLRVNNEFYIAPVYNGLIAEGCGVSATEVEEMWGLGTPEDLRAYEDAHRT